MNNQTIIDATNKLQLVFEKEKSKKIKVSLLIEKYNYKLVDLAILFTCIIGNEYYVEDFENNISEYIENNDVYRFYDLYIQRIEGDFNGT